MTIGVWFQVLFSYIKRLNKEACWTNILQGLSFDFVRLVVFFVLCLFGYVYFDTSLQAFPVVKCCWECFLWTALLHVDLTFFVLETAISDKLILIYTRKIAETATIVRVFVKHILCYCYQASVLLIIYSLTIHKSVLNFKRSLSSNYKI